MDRHWDRNRRWVGQTLRLSFFVTRVRAAGDALGLHERFALHALVLHDRDLRGQHMGLSHNLVVNEHQSVLNTCTLFSEAVFNTDKHHQ